MTMEAKTNPWEKSLNHILWASLLPQLLIMTLPTEASCVVATRGSKTRGDVVPIPYAFGISPGCFVESPELNCSKTNSTCWPFHANVADSCYISATREEDSDRGFTLAITQYRFSTVLKRFTTISRDTLVYTEVEDCNVLTTLTNGSCSPIGAYEISLPTDVDNYGASFNRWPYYFVTPKLYEGERKLVERAIGDGTCETTYACVSDNSECIDLHNGSGYYCNCLEGYQGNPYLVGGCQDMDQCDHNGRFSSPGPPRICKNTSEGYTCSTDGERALVTPLVIGINVSIIFLVLLFVCVYISSVRRKLRQVKEKYFRQHGGWLLYEEMRSKQQLAFKIFTKEELQEATNNFDDNTILGRGAYGTVYKGTLKDNRTVAIKRSKVINESQRKEFGKEMLILSQINHKNVVKLLGCCLEVEVPMLVYEFVPNGTLFQFIHRKNKTSHVSLQTRLRIAHESAEALSYLHSWASPPIIHGDIKPSNVLLDENYMAKVSDFGASMLAPIDETSRSVALVQGTYGYLDPMYLQTGILTDKSDVYSFGVVLLELLTGKEVLSFEVPEEVRCLPSNFVNAMKADRLHELLNDQIIDEEEMELIMELAKLAMTCLSAKGEERPKMKEVAEELDRLRKIMDHSWVCHTPEVMGSLFVESSSSKIIHETQITVYYSLEEKPVVDTEDGL